MLRSEFDALPWQDEFESSNIARVAFVNTGEPVAVAERERLPITGKLYVEFQGGRVYRYDAIREEAVKELVAAESVGGYFNAEIKGSHEYERVQVEHDPV